MSDDTTTNQKADLSVDVDTYDRGIVPAETAARKEREGDRYKHTPHQDPQDAQAGSINTTDGYTVDKEGLIDNFPIEPEMYINEPGDLRDEQEADEVERAHERNEVNQNDETGKLTMDQDTRGKGPGLV